MSDEHEEIVIGLYTSTWTLCKSLDALCKLLNQLQGMPLRKFTRSAHSGWIKVIRFYVGTMLNNDKDLRPDDVTLLHDIDRTLSRLETPWGNGKDDTLAKIGADINELVKRADRLGWSLPF